MNFRSNLDNKDLKQRIAKLSPEKQKALLKLLQHEGIENLKLPIAPTQRTSNQFPLSFTQERLWFLNQLEGLSNKYNIPIALQIQGNLNIAVLEQALATIIQRHEILRTRFTTNNGTPVQVIDSNTNLTMQLVDLQEFPQDQRYDQVQQKVKEELETSFDLSQNSLLQVKLLQVANQEFVLLVNMHHIICDGWSIGIFIQELFTLYQAFLSKSPSFLPNLPIQYADFVVWQRQWWHGERLETQLNYWKQQLSDAAPILELPSDRPRPPVQIFKGKSLTFTLNSGLKQQLQTLSKNTGTTLYMTLLAAFATLLYRYSSQDDISIGSPIANRNRFESEPLIGCFVNTLVLRIRIKDNPSFAELLTQVRQVALDSYEHQDTPFEKVVEALQPERNLSYNPLFQVMFVLQNTPVGQLEVLGLSLTPLALEAVSTNFDITLSMEETEEGLTGIWEYSSTLFNKETIARMAENFQVLLAAIVTNPDQLIAQLPLLTDSQRQQLLVEWNNTVTEYPIDKTIPQVFEEQVQKTPDAIAVVFGNQQLTYQQLNCRANKIAHHLQSFGVGKEALVGICLERSVEMVVGLLAILKAGGAYVPLDPNYPQERLSYMLEDAGVTVLLTQQQLVELLPPHRARVICLDSDWEVISTQSQENAVSGVSPTNLAYVIYTSGSTGKPKGVMIEHRGVVNLANWQVHRFKVTEKSCIAQFFSYSFDGAVGETFMALLNGATLFMLDRTNLTPERMIQAINYHRVTNIVLVPSIIKQLNLELLNNSTNLSLVSVGEKCPIDLAKKWANKSNFNFMNAYGPTEYTVYSHIYQINKNQETNTNIVSIGQAIHNTKTYILDSNLNPVPVGIIGEIYISGIGIARGYLNQGQKTLLKFIPNHFYLADKFYEHGLVKIPSSLQDIYQLKIKRQSENIGGKLNKVNLMSISGEKILFLVKNLDDDLIEYTLNFVISNQNHPITYSAFCRYLLEGYHQNYHSCGINQDVLKLFLPEKDLYSIKAIDFGFGNAEIIKTLSQAASQVIGLDINPFFVHQARKQGLDARMAKIDVKPSQFVEEFGIAEYSQDFAISTLTLDRVNHPRNLLENLFKSLKHGGRFAIQTLLPIIPIEDGDIENPVVYTAEENRITPGKSVEEDKLYLISLLYELGARDINICQIPYVVTSRDGIQDYTVWCFFGQKSIKQNAEIANNYYARMYKTGDLARYLPDGNIEFVDRVDNQVKIRGFRIELEEIEAILITHTQIQEAVVVAREDQPNNKRLVAYIVPHSTVSSSQIRNFLKQKLPEYMIPHGFVMLEALPLTPNGKIDLKALPVPDLECDRQVSFVAPRTATEEVLAAIWRDVLGLKEVGIHDNFFELGGDSIISLQIISRANQAGLQLTPKQIFQHQTVGELAAVVNPTPSIRAQQGLVTGFIPLTPIQHWFFEQNFSEPHHFNQAVLLEVAPNLKPALLKQALQHLCLHHDVLRLRFTCYESQWQQANRNEQDPVPFQVLDLSTLSEEQQKAAIETTATAHQRTLNLSKGPLMQVVLFNLGESLPSRLLIVIHHLAVDGVSWRILLEDLSVAYQQQANGETIQLPPKTTSFKEWAHRLLDYGRSPKLNFELDYWLAHHSANLPPLPVDDGDRLESNTVASSRVVSVSLSVEQTRALLQEVPSAYNTQINDVLLTALVQSFAQWTGFNSLLVNLEGHGREALFEDVDLSRTVGWFTSLFPVLLQLEENRPGVALKSIKEQLRQIPNRGIGYGILKYLSQNHETREQLQTLPQAEVSFNYLGQLDRGRSESILGRFASESCGALMSKSQSRSHLLDINGVVVEGKLQLDWTYSENIHQRSTIERLAQGFIKALTTLIAHCQSPDAVGYTPSDFPDVQLSQEKLDRVLAEINLANTETQVSKKNQNIAAIYPLSSSQKGMLVETLAAKEAGIHLDQIVWTFQGDLNLKAFVQTWQTIIERHSSLKTAFIWKNLNDPLQVVLKQVKVPLKQQDWRKLSSSEQQEKLEDYLRTDRIQGCDLSQAPLMRLAVFQFGEQVYQIVWTVHHILMDGWCLPLIVKELQTFYEAFSNGKNIAIEPSPPYKDYITWLKQQDLFQAEQFWQKTLQGFTKPTSLGIQETEDGFSHQKERYNQQKAYLSASLTAKLQSLTRQHNLTVNTLIQGVWALLLSHYSGESDVVFGATVSGRPPTLPKVESIIGLFINTLPRRIKVAHDTSVWSWLQDIQTQSLEAQAYEYCSSGQVHQWSEVPGQLPLYESILVFQNYPVDSAILQSSCQGFNLLNTRSVGAQTKYPLTIIVSLDSELELNIINNTYRLASSESGKIIEHFLTLLKSIIAKPEQELLTIISQIPKDRIPKIKAYPQQEQQDLREGFVPPRNALELQLAKIWSEILGVSSVGVQDNFFELSGHSLLAVYLMQRIQQQFGKNLQLATLFQSPTIEQLANLICQETDSLPLSALVPIQPSGSKRPLFCVHPIGGNVLCYMNLASCLGPEQPFYGLQSLALDKKNTPNTQVEEMAAHYIEMLQTVQPQGPYLLAGWSFGGLVAFEMAQQLQEQGQQVSLLALIDTYPPSLLNKELQNQEGQDDATLFIDLLADDISPSWEDIKQFEPDERLSYIIEQAKQVNLIPANFGLAQVDTLLKVYKLNRQAAQSYIPRSYQGRLILFQASDNKQDLAQEWETLAEQVENYLVSGNHHTMVRQPHVQILAEKLQNCLEQAV